MASTINASSTGSGGLITTGDASGELALQANGVTKATVTSAGLSLSSTSSINALNTFGFENRIINGDMRIDQRYGGTAYSPANGFSVDRWTSGYYAPAGGTYSAQQVVDAPAGFYNSLKMTVTATPSNNTDAFFQLYQPIEANNVADFGLGTANAKPFTLSFWVKSSLTGTFCVAFGNNTSPAYYYISTYTINTANTWEFKTITVTGPTAGTWGTTNGQGLAVFFDLGSGTTQDAPSANTWNAGNYRRVSSGVRLIGTNGATLNVTGVQLEAGSQATSFDFRSIGQELALCQRYYQQRGGNSADERIASGFVYISTQGRFTYPTRVVMRTSPTLTVSSGTDFNIEIAGAAVTSTSLSLDQPSPEIIAINCNVASGLTGGAGCQLQARSTNARIMFSAEL